MDLATEKAEFLGGNQTTIYMNLMRQEWQKWAGKRLYRVTGKINSGSLLKVLILEEGEWVELTEKSAIESTIYKENNKKFI